VVSGTAISTTLLSSDVVKETVALPTRVSPSPPVKSRGTPAPLIVMLNSAPPAKPKIWWPVVSSWSVFSQTVVARPIETGALSAITSEPPVARA
jgi:hypothetical protein